MQPHVDKAFGTGPTVRLRMGVLRRDLDGSKPPTTATAMRPGQLPTALVRRLARSTRDGDVVGRLGGDEFVVVCIDTVEYGALEQAPRRATGTAREPIVVDGARYRAKAAGPGVVRWAEGQAIPSRAGPHGSAPSRRYPHPPLHRRVQGHRMPRLTVLDLRGDRSDPRDRMPRPRVDLAAAREDVEASLAAVRDGGDDALRQLTARFDGVELGEHDGLVVPEEVLDESLARLAPELRAALERAADQVRWFHERARPQDWEDERDGARMGVWHRPVQRAGVYVPGGKAVYPSTVVMTAVPAQVAGVEQLVLCTPPTGTGFDGTPDGWPNRTILAAARLLGVDRVVRVGGAQAVAAMAYGTASVPACDLVVGPGNLYVSLAKQQLAAEGRIGTDGYAGPTEVAVVADDTADPRVVAADLVAQAEHDELATALLITPDAELAAAVEVALETEVAATRHRARVEASLQGQGTVALVDDLDHAVEVAEAFAAEHLEVHTRQARAVAERIRYAGTTFIGQPTPVSLGDYAAGPNHTLPTSGTARFAGGLTTSSFLVPVNFVEYDDAALRDLADSVHVLATSEDLPAHWRAVEVRLERGR